MKRSLFALVVLLGIAAAGGRYAFHLLLDRSVEPFPASMRFDVRSGQSFRSVADRLESVALIPDATALRLWARWTGADRQIQEGAYWLDRPLSPRAILEKFRTGDRMLVRVTLPEGITAVEVARSLASAGVGTEEEYVRLFEDREWIRSLGTPAEALEGYLFPDTYFFSPLDPPQRALATLVRRFQDVFDPRMEVRAKELGMTVPEAVTLASIIEKETADGSERPLIAAVFHNRLRLGMPLQADPTVIYGITDFDGNLTREHLETPTPYNTYTTRGLPPGPIANPGREALVAALYPAEEKFLYFVSRNDGSHEFTTNLSDHNRAVNRWQRRRRAGG